MAVSRSAIMLGSQPIGRLGTLVNWSNSKSFQVEVDAPWAFQEAEESAIATDLKNAEPMALATGNAPEPLPSKSDETLVPAPPAASADIAVKIAEPEAGLKNAEPMALATGDVPEQSLSESDKISVPAPPAASPDIAVKIPEPEASLKNAEPMALATGDVPEQSLSESDKTSVPAPPAASPDIAVEIPEPEASLRNAEPMALATGDASGQLPSDSDRALVPTPPAASIDDSVRRTVSSGQPVIKKLDTAPTFKPPADSNKSKPVSSRVSQTMLPQPTAVQPKFADQSTDAYVQQLEQLVIELNCELGMAIAPPTADNTNPTAWLMQRMIQLNLQNLELKEKLRQNYS